jgi:hypothetical protein
MELNIETLEAKVRELAATRPNYRYQPPYIGATCRYFNTDNTPGCIYGHAIAAFENVPVVLGHDNRPLELDSMGSILWVLANWGLDGGSTAWHESVQCFQDHGKPWGECVRLADLVVKLPDPVGDDLVDWLVDEGVKPDMAGPLATMLEDILNR